MDKTMTTYEEMMIKNTVDSLVSSAMEKTVPVLNSTMKIDRFIRAAVDQIRKDGPSAHGVKVIIKTDKVILTRAD